MQQQALVNPDERYYLKLSLAARELINLEFFSKSDPLCEVLYTLEGEQIQLIGTTECIKDNLDPSWETTISLEYVPDLQQTLTFYVHDKNGKNKALMGECTTTVASIMQSKNQLETIPLKTKGKVAGKLFVKANKHLDSNKFLQLQASGVELMNTDGIFGLSDPFLQFYSIGEGGINCLVHKTEVVKDNLNPVWGPLEISLQHLCGNDETRKFKVECYDLHDKGRNNQFMGMFETTAATLTTTDYKLQMPKGKCGGTIRISKKEIVLRPCFNDHIANGLKFNMVMGIDYSMQNGDPHFPDSLHAIGTPNNTYCQAVTQTAAALQSYNTKIATYGLCAIPQLANFYQETSQFMFPLTGDFKQPQLEGVEQVTLTYNATLRQIKFAGALQLAEFIKYTQQIAEFNSKKNIYTVCVIVCQQEVDDEKAVIEAIGACGKVPVSFIILGLGDYSFKFFKELNHKSAILAKRSLVTFVEYQHSNLKQALLKKHLLQNIPQQVVDYMKIE